MQLGSIELFCKAAELASFTAAAHLLGVTPAAVSRSVGRLELRLGARLFVRTTRHIRLTDDGRAFYEQCTQALSQITEASRAVAGQQRVASGTLKLSVPTTYAHHRVLPLLPKFAKAYPEVHVDVSISNRTIDFVEDGFDLAIRLGVQQDSALVARKLEDATLGVFAAPSYLKKSGVPAQIVDLKQHACIQFVMPSTGRALPWLFSEAGTHIERTFGGQVRVHDDALGCVNYARAGGGLCQIYHFIASESVRRRELVEVLEPFGGRSRPFSILYPQNRHMSARVRVFIAFLLTELSGQLPPSAV